MAPELFLTQMPGKFGVAKNDVHLQGVGVDVDGAVEEVMEKSD